MVDEGASQPLLGHPSPPACNDPTYRRLWRKIFSWQVLKIVLLGQLLSLFLCGTSVASQLLVDNYMVDTPVMQNFISYFLLSLLYTVWLAGRSGESGLLYILKNKWWKYLFLAVVDVEANYCLVKAFQYTTLTSVQLLDCVAIPALMVLSWFILRSRYKWIHYVAVGVCLLGVGTLVYTDVLSGRADGKGSDMLFGDFLVILGACLYAVSDLCQEYVVKKLSCVEFLAMLGLFGAFVSGIQLMALESAAVASIDWNWNVGLLYAGYALCLSGFYSVMTFVVLHSSATSVALGLLTSDIYSLLIGHFLFGYKFSGLYILSFIMIIVGFVLYNSVTMYTSGFLPGKSHEETEKNDTEEVEAPLESVTPLENVSRQLCTVIVDSAH
ncbi:solute carrier family 35 member F2-like [Rana temporaria]|uniref:solute carrier family 35 member F2-like n=1 Tax=Rana temporaria TaxID=8407 RepID=UPI001AACAFD0|nr:solute carrier family 35 member F2-like [Rana temporaria]